MVNLKVLCNFYQYLMDENAIKTDWSIFSNKYGQKRVIYHVNLKSKFRFTW